jgi:hypothetical protein
MDDVLLLLHGLMKLTLVAGVMVLVATAPSLADTPGRALEVGEAQTTSHHQDDKHSWGHRMLHADDDRWLDFDDTSPSMNLDGTPMCGDLDLNGNFYGESGSAFDSWDGSTSSMWD